MINVSEEFRQLMQERTDFKAHAQITLADGMELTVTDDEFAASGVTLTDGAGASGLPLGVAVCRTVQLEIVNADGWLDAYDFFGARIRLWLTFALSETVERVELGTFTVTEPETWGETVTITAADDMIRADRLYTPGAAGETALGQLWRDVCAQCGIAFSGEAIPNGDMNVTVPAEECTCRQMLGWIAMLAGGNARIDRQGTARVLVYDGGRGTDHKLTDWATLSTDTDDVIITGVEIGTDDGTVLEGAEGYVLTVENPLVEGREAEAMRRLGDVMIGLTLRRFDGSHVGYPLAECMDTVRFRDRRGRWYNSVITDVTFTCSACTSLSNSAEGVVRNGSRYVSAETKARQASRKLYQKEKTAREALAEQLQKQLAEASGFYTTDVEQEDGSIIRYTHDKPTLAASKNVIKWAGDTIGLSTDGGKTYPFGLTVDGKTIMDIVAANGVIADWIKAGILQSQDGKTFFCDLVKGILRMDATELTIQGKSVNEALSDAVTSVVQQYYLSDSPTKLTGGNWSGTQPAWTAGKYIWNRQHVKYGNGEEAYLPSEAGVCITGNTGADGTDGKDGRGVLSSTVMYQEAESGTVIPDGAWSETVPPVPAGRYLWTRTVITYTDSDSTTLYTVGRIGADGAAGENGANGVGIKSITNYYLASASAAGVTVDTEGWSTSVQSVSAACPYLWNYEVTDYTDGSSATVAPHIVGTYGRDGTNGAAGKGISSIAEHYLATSAVGGVTTNTPGWTEALQQTDTMNRYLWNYETIAYTDGSSSTVEPRIIGTHGATGDAGAPGTNGENGVGISSIVTEYRVSPSNEYPDADPMSKWQADMPMIPESYYLWTRQVITYSDSPDHVEYAGMYCLTKAMTDALTDIDIMNKLTDNGRRKGIFFQDSELYISASAILSGVLDAARIAISGKYGSILQGEGSTVVNGVEIPTTGLLAMGPKGLLGPLLLLSEIGARLSAKNGGTSIYVTDGFVTTQNGVMRVEEAIAMALAGESTYQQALRMLGGDPKALQVGNENINVLIRGGKRIRIQADEIVLQGQVIQG